MPNRRPRPSRPHVYVYRQFKRWRHSKCARTDNKEGTKHRKKGKQCTHLMDVELSAAKTPERTHSLHYQQKKMRALCACQPYEWNHLNRGSTDTFLSRRTFHHDEELGTGSQDVEEGRCGTGARRWRQRLGSGSVARVQSVPHVPRSPIVRCTCSPPSPLPHVMFIC